MKRRSLFLIFSLVSFSNLAQAQSDNFTIGIAESIATMLTDGKQQHVNIPYDCYNRVTFTDTSYLGNPTSHLNVFAQDGFNMVMPLAPGTWCFSDYRLKTYLILAKKFNLQVIPFTADWFVPLSAIHDGNGINVYNNDLSIEPFNLTNKRDYNDPYQNCKARANYEFLFKKVFNDPVLRDVVKGFHIGGELNHTHLFNPGVEVGDYGASYMVSREIPPKNVDEATAWFNEQKIGNQKTYISYVNHGSSFHYGTDDVEYDGKAYQNSPIDYNVGDYLKLKNKPDVALEDSYFRWTDAMDKDWVNQPYSNIQNNGPLCDIPEECNRHYLSKFKNIDLLKTLIPEVYATFTFEKYWEHNGQDFKDEHYNSTSANNGNLMWFQVYTSIIHGVNGIIFYGIDTYTKDEDSLKRTFLNSTQINRYDRKYRSGVYNQFTAPLAKELRYLSNNGFLGLNGSSVIFEKQDYKDSNRIVPDADSYIPWIMPREKETENYGLRYTIRKNEKNEVILIISNPLNVKVKAKLDFSQIKEAVIQNATGLEYLFQDLSTNVNSGYYKKNRDSEIDLENNNVQLKAYEEFDASKKVKLKFGPLDVLILKFVTLPSDI